MFMVWFEMAPIFAGDFIKAAGTTLELLITQHNILFAAKQQKKSAKSRDKFIAPISTEPRSIRSSLTSEHRAKNREEHTNEFSEITRHLKTTPPSGGCSCVIMDANGKLFKADGTSMMT
eukprot:TRINITY_DN23988_c0_g1_i1.p5 TRINITY_DN23988_c0_g1~~TRINITY_DN23988_c0_g1_i1.p5  ORF type:complete len:119 (+),score=33.68 TRINITY_DN23988_c0_g1_i1:420-776(+)